MSRFLIETRRGLPAYEPGSHEEGAGFIRLNTNESPYPPSEEVQRAIESELGMLQYYNDPDCTALREALALHCGVRAENIMAGNGSDQVLQLAFAAFGRGRVALPEITYSYYDLFAAYYGLEIRRIPMDGAFCLREEDLYGMGEMLVFPNPNAPSGRALPLPAIERVLLRNPDQVVVVDEAYVDFGAESAAGLVERFDNLLVVRTFSKSGSLAGLRLGYAIGSPDLIEDLSTVRNAVDLYGVNRLAQAAGVAACQNWDYYAGNCKKIMETRAWTQKALAELKMEVIPSLGNFVFARPTFMDAGALKDRLEEQHILVRHFIGEKTGQYLRITIGTQQEMERLAQAVAAILEDQRCGQQK